MERISTTNLLRIAVRAGSEPMKYPFDMRRKNSGTGIPRPFVLTIVLASILFELQAQEYEKQTVWPGRTWKVASSPELAGWSSKKLAVAKAYGDSIHSSAVIVVQVGEVIYERWTFRRVTYLVLDLQELDQSVVRNLRRRGRDRCERNSREARNR
jgi:hypothetical protein